MQKKISKLPFKGTAEQEKKLREIIDANKHDKSLLMAVMQQAQDVYGYLPMEVQEMIAEGMDVPLEKVYGVSTFYAQFSLSPKGEYNISLTACRCIGACGLAPVLTVNDEVYGRLTVDDVDGILEKYGFGK